MSSSEATPSSSSSAIPFRSKKTLRSSSKSPFPDPNTFTSKTPEKAPQLIRRVRNRNALLSLKEVRRAAESLDESHSQKPQNRTDTKKSARRKIDSWSKESSVSKSINPINAPSKLPEEYEMLSEFFDSLDSAIRLSKLKGSSSTFANICPKIECLTDRRFSYDHLAQLMFILPEVFEVKKVLVIEERTSCMKPDLHIALSSDALEKDCKSKTGSWSMHLRKLFRMRLTDFANSHPQNEEVPKAILPEPFNRSSQDLPKPSSGLLVNTPTNSKTTLRFSVLSNDEGKQLSFDYSRQDQIVNGSGASNLAQLAVASHIPPHFSRRFSKETNNDSENHKVSKLDNQCSAFIDLDSSLARVSSDVEKSFSIAASSSKLPSMEASNAKCSKNCASPAQLPTPSEDMANTTNHYNSSTETYGIHSTPAKLVLTPGKLMISTPALAPPRKSIMSPDEDITFSPKKLVRRSLRSRSLKFDTPVKNERTDNDSPSTGSVDDDIIDILPQSLLQSIREKELKMKEEQNPAISQAKRRQKMISKLPKLFDMIHFLLQSIKRSVITKDELIHKIIAGHSEIVDRRELEEQLSLLLELAPEWISEKKGSGGDLLLCISKISSPKTTRAQLEEAN